MKSPSVRVQNKNSSDLWLFFASANLKNLIKSLRKVFKLMNLYKHISLSIWLVYS